MQGDDTDSIKNDAFSENKTPRDEQVRENNFQSTPSDHNSYLEWFLGDLVSEIRKHHKDDVLSVVLFGSATTGEWEKGKSDVDFIVIVKDKNKKRQIEDFLRKLLLELDKRHGLNLQDTCTIFKRTKNPAENAFIKLQSTMMFGNPFYVLAKENVDFQKGTVRGDPKIELGTRVLVSFHTFLHRIKSTGRVIYGEDITKQLPDTIPRLEKFKASLNVIMLVVAGMIYLPIRKEEAFKLALKANFWACEDALFVLERPFSSSKKQLQEIVTIIGKTNRSNNSKRVVDIDTSHLERCLQYKEGKIRHPTDAVGVFDFMTKTVSFVGKLYAALLRKALINS